MADRVTAASSEVAATASAVNARATALSSEIAARSSVATVRATALNVDIAATSAATLTRVTELNIEYAIAYPAPTVNFTSSALTACGLITLSWTTVNAVSVSIDNGIGVVPLNGSITVNPAAASTVYTITVTGFASQIATSSLTASRYVVTPDIKSVVVSYFNGGANFIAGQYWISYITGSYRYMYRPAYTYTVNGNLDIANPVQGYLPGFKVTDGAGNVIPAPGLFDEFSTEAACATANAGLKVPFQHVGGKPIGVYLNDLPYDDNISGTPAPTFQLCGPLSVTLTAPTGAILAGHPITLTWTSINATTLSIDNGIGAVASAGSTTVSPLLTTTYTITANYSGLSITALVTVTVTPPQSPAFLLASGKPVGQVLLQWPPALYDDGYIIERSPDGISSWTQLLKT
jgi:hypothetical protein